jgi:hypothetical protein
LPPNSTASPPARSNSSRRPRQPGTR